MTGRGHVRLRARLVDVAEAAGVSLGAASKALSAPHAVRPATLAAVRAAVAQLGYVPSEAGRMLASRSTRMIGVVLPSLYHPVYAAYFHGLQKQLGAQGYLTAALSHEFDRAAERELVEQLVRRSVDALVLIGVHHHPATMELIDRIALPHIFSWAGDAAPETGAVGFSDSGGMAEVVAHLAGHGHRRIAMLNGNPDDNERARWRQRGMEDAAASHGMDLAEVVTVPLTIRGGQQGYRLADPVRRGITALLCSTDLLAAGALHAARIDGVSVPRTLSITGFDDIEMAELLVPALTTVRVPVADLASKTADRLIATLRGDSPAPSELLPTRLVVRDSSGWVS